MSQNEDLDPQIKSSFRYFIQTYWEKKVQSTLVIITGVISNVFEGLGITLLIPIFTLLMDQGRKADIAESNKFAQYFTQIYASFGLELNITTALIGFVLIILMGTGALLLQRLFIAHFNFQYEYDISCTLYNALFSAKWFALAKFKRGELIATFTKEINFARTVFLNFLEILSNGVKITTLLIFSCFISVKLTLLVIMVGFCMFLFVKNLSKIARRCGNRSKKARFELIEVLVGVLDNLKFIKLMSLEKSNNDRLERSTKEMRDASIKVEWQKHIVFAVNHSIMAIIVAIVLYVGTTTFHMQLPQVLVLLLIYARLSPYLVASLSQYNWINSMLISMITVNELKEELMANVEEIDGKQKADFGGSIEFKHADFYFGDKPILKDVNFKIERGEYIAVIGETGSGKTTILDLILLLLFPTKGEMLIDGVSSRDIDLNQWRNQISYIGPENYLIAESIKENLLITHNRDDVPSDEIINRMLQKASLGDYLARIQEGIHFKLQDRGNNLSTGQKQRLNLARAFLRDGSIFIMDEPTSALDFETEKYIREEIRKLKGQKTVIVVTHKRELAEDADRILEIQDHQIKEVTSCYA